MKDERPAQRIPYTTRPPFILQSFVILILILLVSQAAAGQTNINTAAKQELITLPYIGEVKAEAIINHRRNNGLFRSIQDIQKVPGIGEKSFLILEPFISVESTPSTPAPDQNKQRKSSLPREDGLPFAQNIRTGQIIILTNQQYLPVLKNFIQTAQHRIDIAMYIFKVGKAKSNGPHQVMDELIRAQKRGVKVSVMLENSSYSDSLNEDNHRVARILRKNHIDVRFDSKKQTTHTKIVIIDGRFAFIGSHNFTNSALTKNNEITLLLDNPRVVRDISFYLRSIH